MLDRHTLQARAAPLAPHLCPLKAVIFDFDGVFTDNAVHVLQDGREAVRCSRFDGIGLARLRELGMVLLILSSEANPVVTARGIKLKIPVIQDCADKQATLTDFLARQGIGLHETAFLGNDINDLHCLQAVALPMVVADAHPDVVAFARYQTATPGGYGAVREVCDLIWLAKTTLCQGNVHESF